MASITDERDFHVRDLSGAVQRQTTKFMSAPNEVDLAINADFSRIGGVTVIKGSEQYQNTITTTSTSTSSSTSSSTSTSSTTTP